MSAPHHPDGDDRRRFLRFLAASPLLAAGGVDLGALERLTSAGNPDDGWRLLDEVTRATEAPRGGAPSSGASPLPSQPIAWDAYTRLGYERAAALVGLPAELVARALPIDPNRSPPKEPPSAPLLARAGALETRT